MPVSDATRRRTDEVYQTVRSDLLSARYAPGQWLKVSDLQKSLAASVSVVREALSRLVAEGLLVSYAQRGFRVVELSVEDLRELTAARIEIETLVLRDSLASGGPTWEAELVAAHHLLESTPLMVGEPARLNHEWVPIHAGFHEALLAGCANWRLLAIATGLRDNAEMYRMWSPSVRYGARNVAAEHKELTRLALAREIDACADLLATHIGHTQDSLLRAHGTS